MIPLRDHTPPERFPIVTPFLIGINAIVFMYMLSLSETGIEAFIGQFALIPNDISSGRNLATLITSMFLHGGFGHIIGNMLFLHIFGDNLESSLGKMRFLLYYLMAGIAGSAAQIFINPDSTIPNIGASGAISGILAGYLMMFPHHKIDVLFSFGLVMQRSTVPAYTMIVYWFIVQFFSGIGSLTVVEEMTGGVAYFAHLGGFVAGFILLPFFRARRTVF